MGVVQDRTSGQVFHRRLEDAFFLEVANSSNNTLLKRLRVCQLMPSHAVEVSRDTLSTDKPYVFWNDRIIRMRRNEPLQFVCKVCKRMIFLHLTQFRRSTCKRLMLEPLRMSDVSLILIPLLCGTCLHRLVSVLYSVSVPSF